MGFSVTILGSNSATPVYGRHPSAQVIIVDQQYYLVDCGEGTQMQMNAYQIKRNKINHIFISHIHGDHYFGLAPLLDSYCLGGRTAPLHVYGPPTLKQVIDLHLTITGAKDWYSYEIIFHETQVDEPTLLLDDGFVTVHTIVLTHGQPCTGFVFRQKAKDRKMIKEKIATYNISYTKIKEIKKGADLILADGQIIPNEALTLDPPPTFSYAYCADTSYKEDIIPCIEGVDLLYHEATYLEDMKEVAKKRGHSTTKEAASLAKEAKVKRLIIGHFSSRYKDLSPFLEEAITVFTPTELAIEGTTFNLG